MTEFILRKLLKIFWENVQIDDQNKCWEFKSWKNKDGYATLRVRDNPIKKIVCGYTITKYVTVSVYAHRLSWFIFNGEWPSIYLGVLHKCDNPSCINPTHLFLGTDQDNRTDMANKNRTGLSNILTIDEVNQVRELLKQNNLNQTQIAIKFGVHPSTISDIKTGRCWNKYAPIITKNN